LLNADDKQTVLSQLDQKDSNISIGIDVYATTDAVSKQNKKAVLS